MAKIIPFRGILYNTSKVAMEDVLAPPYDVITPEYREALYMQSPNNIVRIDFGKELPSDTDSEDRYVRARRYLEEWLRDGIFIRSYKPSFYAYEMAYEVLNQKRRLLGFLALVKLEELTVNGMTAVDWCCDPWGVRSSDAIKKRQRQECPEPVAK